MAKPYRAYDLSGRKEGSMKAWKWGCLLVGLIGALLAAPATASAVSLQSIGPSFDQPIYVAAPPGDPRLFVVERPGRIQVVHDNTVTQFLDIHTLVATDGERGLLSMAFDPNYASNGLFYVFFNDNGTAGAPLGDIHVDEFRVTGDPNVADPASRRPVFTVTRATGASNHNGGQLQFGKDGFLYASVGDAATAANAQNPGNLNGKILRIDPHVAGAPQVWSLGLRNPFRFSFDQLTGDMLIGDVGQASFEEIDFAAAASGLGGGANYGWPCREGFAPGPVACSGSFTDPVFAYADSAPCSAVIAGYVYRGSLAPELSGRFLYTDLCHTEIRSFVPGAGDDRSEGVSLTGSPWSFGEDGACNLYVSAGSSVFRIVGSGGTGASTCPTAPCPCTPISGPSACCPPATTKKGKKCRKHHKKKHRAAESKKKHKKHKKCRKHKKRHKKRI
jgi:glucose/arabinose dehydrogenase